MTSQYVHLAAQHLAVINEHVFPMDKLKIKPLNGPYIDFVKRTREGKPTAQARTLQSDKTDSYAQLASDRAAITKERVAPMDKLNVKVGAQPARGQAVVVDGEGVCRA